MVHCQKNDKFDVVLYFLLGNSPASEFYMPTFRNTLSVGVCRMTRLETCLGYYTGKSLARKWPEAPTQHQERRWPDLKQIVETATTQA